MGFAIVEGAAAKQHRMLAILVILEDNPTCAVDQRVDRKDNEIKIQIAVTGDSSGSVIINVAASWS